MLFYHAMHDGDVAAFDVVNDHVTYVDSLFAIGEDEEVASVEDGFHTPGEDDDDGRGRVGVET
jgi:hypothetical protein